MKALLYLAESQNQNTNKEKLAVMSLWAEVREIQVVGVVYELNEQQTLGEAGRTAIFSVLEQMEVDALVILSAKDLGQAKPQICECVQMVHMMGADVIAIHGDLPNCEECKSEPKQEANHCIVTIFMEETGAKPKGEKNGEQAAIREFPKV